MDMKNVCRALSEISEGQYIYILSGKKKTDMMNSISEMFKCYETERKSAI